MALVAVIGTRTPTDKQIKYIQDYIVSLDPETQIISGCADGVDLIAMKAARERGLRTIGVIPYDRFKRKNQVYADEIIDLSMVEEELRKAAYESVRKHHPARGGSKVSFLLHARNHLVVYKADKILALPAATADFGGTAQGIRLSRVLGIPITVINEHGNEVRDGHELL